MLILLSVLLVAIQAIIGIIPIINKKPHDSANPNQSSGTRDVKYEKSDYWMIGLWILGLGFTVFILLINHQSEKDKADDEKKFQDTLNFKLAQRDSLHRFQDSIKEDEHRKNDSSQADLYAARVDSSYEKSIRASNEALGKYNLVLIDSLDRVEKKLNIKSINRPEIDVRAVGVGETPPIYFAKEEGLPWIAMKLESHNNVAYNVKLRYVVFRIDYYRARSNMIILDSGFVFFEREMLVTDRFTTASIPVSPVVSNNENVLVYVYGNFSSDRENTSKTPFSIVFAFDIKAKRWMVTYTDVNKRNIERQLKSMRVLKVD